MNKINVFAVGTSLVLGVFCGCATSDPKVSVVDEISKIDAQDGKDIVTQMTISDGNFSYTLGDDGTRRFVRDNAKSTLNDLNDFAVAKCWNGYLLKKLQDGQKLTREDAILVDFCMNVQLNMIDALAVASLGDMTSPGYLHSFVVDMQDKSKRQALELEGIYKDQTDVFVDLKVNFITDNSGVRAPMRNWGEGFQKVSPETLKRIYSDVLAGTGAADISNGSRPWLWIAYGAGMILAGPIGAGVVGGIHAMTPGELNVIEKESAKYSGSAVEIKNNWQSARNSIKGYCPELLRMRRTLENFRTGSSQLDPQTRKFLQKILAESENNTLAVQQYYDYALYDLPFCVQTYAARARLKECKGFFNDDEKKMKEIMAAYCTAVSGTDMISHIRSRYAANGYKELITFFKGELSKQEFDDFVAESKLYNIDQKTEDDGRQNNDCTPVK